MKQTQKAIYLALQESRMDEEIPVGFLPINTRDSAIKEAGGIGLMNSGVAIAGKVSTRSEAMRYIVENVLPEDVALQRRLQKLEDDVEDLKEKEQAKQGGSYGQEQRNSSWNCGSSRRGRRLPAPATKSRG